VLVRAADRVFAAPFTDDDALGSDLDVLASASAPFYDAPRHRWLVTRPEQARAVLTDRRMVNDLRRARGGTQSARLVDRLGVNRPSLLFLDPPEHTAVRGALNAWFSVTSIRARRERMLSIAREIVAVARSRPAVALGADVVQPFCQTTLFDAVELPELGGMSDRVDDDLFAMSSVFDVQSEPAAVAPGVAAGERIRRQLGELLRRSAVGEALRRSRVPDDVALASMDLVLRAGVVTAGCLLVKAVGELLTGGADRSPQDLEALLVRSSPALDAGRITAATVPVGGTEIPAGASVTTLLATANREFLAPGGPPLSRHLAFGGGRHRCLGEALVRQQLHTLAEAIHDAGWRASETRAVTSCATPNFRGVREAVATTA
jgi:cytochrome P450